MSRLLIVILFGLLAIGATLLLVHTQRDTATSIDSSQVSSKIGQQLAAQFAAFEAKEKQVSETVWAKEILAQECGRTFEMLWNSLNAVTNKLNLVASFPVGEIVLGKWLPPQILPHGIELQVPADRGRSLSAEAWRQFVEEFERAGWQLSQTEFRQNRFDTNEAGQPRQSQFYFSAHLINLRRSQRAILEGDLVVDWAAKPLGEELVPVQRIDASRLTIKTRRGEPPFRPILSERITPPGTKIPIDPLIVYDLDGDGVSEIILPTVNLVYRRHGDDRYETEPLWKYPPGLIQAGIIADFDGDGAADVLCARVEGLLLFKGSPQGSFDQRGQLAWSASPRLTNTMVLTCGDIDHDGHLDVFLGQYKVPSLGQILRPDFYEANDGYPAFLLRNDGHGKFTDVTLDAGLEKKRWRRVFSASFADLDNHGNLDLLVVSDFAGVDLYRNDGHGHFIDLTRDWVADPHAFGMGHTLADFNADGRLDFLMIGMNSPTVDRLEHLGLTRPSATEDRTMRRRMTFGNRLFLAQPRGGFQQTVLNDSIARSGWSWGTSACDFDNDGFPDVYIANGHETKQNVRDYESEFWLHDIYVDDAVDDSTATAYFTGKSTRTRGAGWSYGGYEKNRLYLNQQGGSFLEAAHLMDVALEQDSRCVVTDDLEADGRMDLLLTTFEVWPEAKQTLRVYKNTLDDSGNWIGFRFREAPGKSPVGVRVTVRFAGHSVVRQIVTGDSFRSQHANTLHFGLGKNKRVDSVEIRWPNGQSAGLREPAVNRWHSVRPPEDSPIQR